MSINGFNGLRTRPNIPLTVPTRPKRHCARCGAVLRPSNHTDTCAPCDRGELGIPDWAVFLVSSDPTVANLTQVAELLDPEVKRARVKGYAERNAEIVRRVEAGEGQGTVGKQYGITRTTVQGILERTRKLESIQER